MDASQKKLASPCGLYCGVCALYRAYKTDNQKLKEKLGNIYGIDPKDIVCEGCLSDVVIGFCRACQVRECALGKKVDGCYECDEFPCSRIKEFPYEAARSFMINSSLKRRELGTEKWVEWETARFTCRSCGAIAFRDAKRCPECKAELSVEK